MTRAREMRVDTRCLPGAHFLVDDGGHDDNGDEEVDEDEIARMTACIGVMR